VAYFWEDSVGIGFAEGSDLIFERAMVLLRSPKLEIDGFWRSTHRFVL
jgi:hypothetical protein